MGLIRLSDSLLGVNGGKPLAQLRFLSNIIELYFDVFKPDAPRRNRVMIRFFS